MKKELTNKKYVALHITVSIMAILGLPLELTYKLIKNIYVTFKFVFTGKMKQTKELLDEPKILTIKELYKEAFERKENK